jgi:hypothetical protein
MRLPDALNTCIDTPAATPSHPPSHLGRDDALVDEQSFEGLGCLNPRGLSTLQVNSILLNLAHSSSSSSAAAAAAAAVRGSEQQQGQVLSSSSNVIRFVLNLVHVLVANTKAEPPRLYPSACCAILSLLSWLQGIWRLH